jgi:hypothetical protein
MLPEDIKYFVDALKKMGENFKFIAIEETKDTYKIYIYSYTDGVFITYKSAEEVHGEPDVIVCNSLVCLSFRGTILHTSLSTGKIE